MPGAMMTAHARDPARQDRVAEALDLLPQLLALLRGGRRRDGVRARPAEALLDPRDDLALVHVADAPVVRAGLRISSGRGRERRLCLGEPRNPLRRAKRHEQFPACDLVIHLDVHLADTAGRMNLDLRQVGGRVLLVSQFTLVASLDRGRRPSFDRAAPPEEARQRLAELAAHLAAAGVPVEQGRFGAHMAVKLVNDGPVTFVLDL